MSERASYGMSEPANGVSEPTIGVNKHTNGVSDQSDCSAAKHCIASEWVKRRERPSGQFKTRLSACRNTPNVLAMSIGDPALTDNA